MLPKANIQRSIFDRSSSHKTSFNAGRLIPFYIDEVLPGDTFDITTSKVVRSQTMLAPIMDDLYLDTYWFFVPNRLVWEHWEEFCGENKSGPWAQKVEYRIPRLSCPVLAPSGLVTRFKPGTLADYFGLPIQSSWDANDHYAPSVLPFRGYALICNHFFRDENLTSPLLVPLNDANQKGSNGSGLEDVANGGFPFKVAKYHDYFSSALPAPQKGDPVSVPIDFADDFTLPVLPLGKFVAPSEASRNFVSYHDVAPLYFGFSSGHSSTTATSPTSFNATFQGSSQSSSVGLKPINNYTSSGGSGTGVFTVADSATSTGNLIATSSSGGDPDRASVPLNLFAVGRSVPEFLAGSDVYSGSSGTAGFAINNLRLAAALQSFLEALARGGSRYGEMIATIFGVQNPDARLQHPEYLGGNRVPLNINQVTNTAQQENDPLGDVGAQSATSDVHSDFIKSFTEHGFLFGLCCVRYDHTYSQGLEKFWTRDTFTDFYNPKFANLGEVPVRTFEIWNPEGKDNPTSASDIKGLSSDVFGYQEIWADYRYKPNRVSGEMRPQHPQTLAHWHLADNYDTQPHLSDEWIREDASNVDRVLAVSSSVSNQFWADFYVKCRATRCMPMYSIPALEPRL